MNSYILSRQWFDFAFENPDQITVTQAALYMWLIEVNNRSGWSEKFAFNTEDAGKAIGVHNRKTIWKALNELAENGFVSIIYKSSHRHKPSVICLPVTQHELKGSLDKSLSYQSENWTSKGTVSGQVREQYGNGKGTVSGHSYKPLNNKTNKPSGSAEPENGLSLLDKFETCQKIYPGTKRGAPTEFNDLKKKFKGEVTTEFLRAIYVGISQKIRINKDLEKAGQFVPEWPHLKTYLNQRRWEEQTEVKASPEPFREPSAFKSLEERYDYWGGVNPNFHLNKVG
jgi:hypothetical protein